MNKKFLTIFLSLFFVSMLSIGCSNKDKTGAGDGSTTSKGIEQYNGNTYVSSKIQINNQLGYLWISVKDNKVSFEPSENANTAPEFGVTIPYFTVTGSGTDYGFSIPDSKQNPDSIVGTLKFSDDASYVTLNITKNGDDPTGETLNKHFVCNIKK